MTTFPAAPVRAALQSFLSQNRAAIAAAREAVAAFEAAQGVLAELKSLEARVALAEREEEATRPFRCECGVPLPPGCPPTRAFEAPATHAAARASTAPGWVFPHFSCGCGLTGESLCPPCAAEEATHPPLHTEQCSACWR